MGSGTNSEVDPDRSVGLAHSDLKEVRLLSRIVTWKETGSMYEADQKHVKICLKEVGPEETSKVVKTHVHRSSEGQREVAKEL